MGMYLLQFSHVLIDGQHLTLASGFTKTKVFSMAQLFILFPPP
jgi:hypothetical protein